MSCNPRDRTSSAATWPTSPEQFGFALKRIKNLNFLVHGGNFLLQVLPGDINLLAQMSKGPRQFPEGGESDQPGHVGGEAASPSVTCACPGLSESSPPAAETVDVTASTHTSISTG